MDELDFEFTALEEESGEDSSQEDPEVIEAPDEVDEPPANDAQDLVDQLFAEEGVDFSTDSGDDNNGQSSEEEVAKEEEQSGEELDFGTDDSDNDSGIELDDGSDSSEDTQSFDLDSDSTSRSDLELDMSDGDDQALSLAEEDESDSSDEPPPELGGLELEEDGDLEFEEESEPQEEVVEPQESIESLEEDGPRPPAPKFSDQNGHLDEHATSIINGLGDELKEDYEATEPEPEDLEYPDMGMTSDNTSTDSFPYKQEDTAEGVNEETSPEKIDESEEMGEMTKSFDAQIDESEQEEEADSNFEEEVQLQPESGPESEPEPQLQLEPETEPESENEPQHLQTKHTDDKHLADYREMVAHHQQELMQLQVTIQDLREDRTRMIEQLEKLEDEKREFNQQRLSWQAELDEKNIEMTLIKKRSQDEITNLRSELQLVEDKKSLYELKVKKYNEEMNRLNQKVKLDFKKIQAREKSLENQLELLKADSQMQIKNRDKIILDLKRKIDALEFEVETLVEHDKKSKENSYALEDKLNKVMSTLRMTIGLLEEDELDLNDLENLKISSLKKSDVKLDS